MAKQRNRPTDGLTHREIAELEGVTPNAIVEAEQRALKKIRKALMTAEEYAELMLELKRKSRR